MEWKRDRKTGQDKKENLLIAKRQIDDGNSYKTGYTVQFKMYSASSNKFKDIASSLWDTTSY